MANIKQQVKRIRKNEEARRRNKAVKSRIKTAIRRYREAVEAGDAEVAGERRREAGRLLDKAAGKGIPHAMWWLGRIHEQGEGVKRDAGRAAEYYRKAADRGHFPSMKSLARMYAHGQGVEKDGKEALAWEIHRRSARAKEAAL